jgi:hypothetical protein
MDDSCPGLSFALHSTPGAWGWWIVNVGRYSFSSVTVDGRGLHVENQGFVAGGIVDDAACSIYRLRTRPCPRAAFSMIHDAPTSGRIFTGISQQLSPEAFDPARSDRFRSFRSIQKKRMAPVRIHRAGAISRSPRSRSSRGDGSRFVGRFVTIAP